MEASADRIEPKLPPIFVERESELTALRTLFETAENGGGALALIAGEPGIGKTRLAQELCRHAEERGAAIGWGRCSEDAGAPPFWPWSQALRSFLSLPSPSPTRQIYTSSASPADLSVLLGQRSGVGGDAAGRGLEVLDAPATRFALFENVCETLRGWGRERALVLVLDDIHAADEASLQLLHFAGRHLHGARILILATYRDIEARQEPKRADRIAAVGRCGAHLLLAGLSERGVARLLAEHLAANPSQELVARVLRATDGNPFFVDEVSRLLAARGDCAQARDPLSDFAIPHGVRATLRERLGRLSAPCRDMLRFAAVLGRDIDVALLQRATDLPLGRILGFLGDATHGGTVEEARGSVLAYRFVHALVRDVLYDEIPATERPRMHQRVATAMQSIGQAYTEAHIDDLAHHWLRALPCEKGGQALELCVRAAEAATARMAYEDAARHYRNALNALSYRQPYDTAMQAELLLGLGTVQRAAADPEARSSFETAAQLARQTSSTDPRLACLFAKAALGYADHALGIPVMVPEPKTAALLEEALERLGKEDSELRAKLLGRLSMETTAHFDRDRSQRLSREAEEMARRVGAPTTLATTLSYRHFVLWRLDPLADRLDLTTEIIQLAERVGHKELAVQGRSWRVVDCISLGDPLRFDESLKAQAAAAEELKQPRYLWMTVNLAALRALWRAEWTEAEDLAQKALAIGQPTGDPTTANNAVAQMFLLRREQDRLAEVEGLHRFYAETYPDNPTPRATLALIYAELGRLEEARQELEQVAADGFARLRREHRLGVLPFLADTCARLQDRPRAQRVYELLLPYAEINLPYGAAACFGAGAYYLGRLAATLEQWDLAESHFERAIELNQRMQGPAWLAYSELAYALLLRARPNRHAAHRARADTLLAAARDKAERHAMTRLLRELAQLPAAHLDAASAPKKTGPAAALTATTAVQAAARGAGACFRRQGDFWAVADESGLLLHVKDSKGARYIAHLLRHPRRDFPAVDLALLDAPEEVADATPRHGHAAVPHLDRRAREEYRKRLLALREQHQEACGFHDLGRAGRLQEEMDALTQELARATGLHGRERGAGSFAERARLNVTRAIKSVIRRIAAERHDLGQYLLATIRTGTFCRYEPDTRAPINWDL